MVSRHTSELILVDEEILAKVFRGVGCIYYEMVTGRPLFAGQNVQEQLHHIFKKRGTPTEDTWPGISSNSKFLEYRSVNIQSLLTVKIFSVLNDISQNR